MKKKIVFTCICVALIFVCMIAIAYAENGKLTLFSSSSAIDDTANVLVFIADKDINLSNEKKEHILTISKDLESVLTGSLTTQKQTDGSTKICGQIAVALIILIITMPFIFPLMAPPMKRHNLEQHFFLTTMALE